MSLTVIQQAAIDKFLSLKVGALFMKQGTGKTRAALELVNNSDSEQVVFIIPNALVGNLRDEILKWGITKSYIIETYQGIAMSDNRYLSLLSKVQSKKNMIVADESIFIKNDTSKTFNRMKKIASFCEYRLILNGTPITKNEWDIYNQMDFLSEKILKMSRIQFLNTFFKRVVYKKKWQRKREFFVFSDVNVDFLQKLIAPYTFYADLQFDFKENTNHVLIYGDVDDDYYQLKKELLDSIENCEGSIVTQLSKMQHLIFTDRYRLDQIAKYINGQCIVFCNYRNEIEYLHFLVGGYIIHGDTKNRYEIINQFKNDQKPLFIMLGIGAFGHNLQFCNKVFFSSITFDFGKIDQALYRIKRIGQTRDIYYTYFESHYGLYKMIEQNLAKKQSLHRLVIEKMGTNYYERL